MCARLPGTPDTCIPLHRKLTYTLTTNVLGCASIFCLPTTLSDNTIQNSTTYVNTSATFDGVNIIGTAPSSVYITQNLTSGSVGQYRLVSACMNIIPQASVLNQAGTIHGTMMKILGATPVTVGTPYPTVSNFTLIPNMECSKFYTPASVSAGQSLRIIWLPDDLTDTEFVTVNSNKYNNDPNSSGNAMIATIVGAPANTPFRIDIYQNFEVSAPFGSVLMGMESVAKESTMPALVWREIFLKYPLDVCVACKNVPNVSRVSERRDRRESISETHSNYDLLDQPAEEMVPVTRENSNLNKALAYVRTVRP